MMCCEGNVFGSNPASQLLAWIGLFCTLASSKEEEGSAPSAIQNPRQY
jgi:hypothetical protein